MLRDEAGFHIKDEFAHYFLLVRVLAMLEAYFDIPSSESIEIILDVLSLLEGDSDIIRQNLYSTRRRVGFRAVLKYTTELCIPNIRNQIEHSGELTADTLELSNMYHKATDKNQLDLLINAVFFFWKASTERT